MLGLMEKNKIKQKNLPNVSHLKIQFKTGKFTLRSKTLLIQYVKIIMF